MLGDGVGRGDGSSVTGLRLGLDVGADVTGFLMGAAEGPELGDGLGVGVFVGTPVGLGVMIGDLVGMLVMGDFVGLVVGGGRGVPAGASTNRSSPDNKLSNFPLLGKIQLRSSSELIPSHWAIPFQTLSQGSVGMKRPLPIQLG
jgi:hypothetical protein